MLFQATWSARANKRKAYDAFRCAACADLLRAATKAARRQDRSVVQEPPWRKLYIHFVHLATRRADLSGEHHPRSDARVPMQGKEGDATLPFLVIGTVFFKKSGARKRFHALLFSLSAFYVGVLWASDYFSLPPRTSSDVRSRLTSVVTLSPVSTL